MPPAGAIGAGFKRTICKFWLQGTCDKGRDCTWSHGEEDEIPVTHPQRAEMDHMIAGLEVKRTICKFFEEGKCHKGDLCTWAHGPEELGVPILREEMFEPLPPPKHFSPQPIFERLPPPRHFSSHPIGLFEEPPLEVKRTICRFWEEGKCQKGDQCSWAHGERELGQQVGGFVQVESFGKRQHHGKGFGRVEVAATPVREVESFGKRQNHGKGFPRVEVAATPAAGTKRSLCKFWLQGLCDKGDLCTWAHGEEEVGSPALEALPVLSLRGRPNAYEKGGKGTVHAFAALGPPPRSFGSGPPMHFRDDHKGFPKGSPKGGMKGGGFADAGKGFKGNGAHHAIGSPALMGPQDQGPVKRTICKFWQQGQCVKGDLCGWAHGEEDIGQPVMEEEPAPWGAGLPPHQEMVEAPVRRTLCKFWLSGGCKQEDGTCTWAHGEEEIGTLVGESLPPRKRARHA